jgi:tRNA-dihydrouridine synthase
MNLKHHLYLAPFQGVTGMVFRQVYSSHFPFIDKYFTPFFTNLSRAKSLHHKARELTHIHYGGVPLVPQVLANEAEEIINFEKHCYDLGFEEINWNLGCPFPRVAAKKRGSGLLPYPDRVDEILQKVKPKLKTRFSVKCRLGYSEPTEVLGLLDIFTHFNISELIVHARLGKQIYKGPVNLDAFGCMLKQARLPVVYNGDIFNIDDFNRLKERFSTIDTWMIGRGLLADPFLPGDIKQVGFGTMEERKQQVRRFVEDLYYGYRKHHSDSLHSISIMKEFWEYLSFSFDRPNRVFSLVKKTKTFDDYEDAVSKVFGEFRWLGSAAMQFHSDSF